MINLANQTLSIQGKEQRITRFEVWFQTPTGLFDNIDLAIKHAVANDWEVMECVRPVSVAIGEFTYEVCGT